MSALALPPGPPALPWFGSMKAIFRDPLAWAIDLGHAYGPIAYTRVGPVRIYALNDPALIEEALVGKHRDCIKDRSTRELAGLVGNGLLTSEGEYWRHHRRLAAPPLQPKRISSYAETMVESAERVFASFGSDEVRQIDADMAEIALEVAGKTLLGFDTRGETERVSAILDASFAHFRRQFYSWHGLLPGWVMTPTRRRFRRAVAELDRMLYEVVRRCRADDQGADHLLARLLRARGEDGESLSDVEVRDEAVTMLLAGHETTALTLTYACYLLALHPEVAARVREEVDEKLADRHVTVADLGGLPYLDAVVRETMRLYPPAYIIGREVISSLEIGGYRVPVGCELLMSPYSLHRNPRLYADPERFRPERWLDGSLTGQPRFAYFPFGGGPRTCIGNHFAMMEATIVLAMFAQRFEVGRAPGFELKVNPAVTLRPTERGVLVAVKRRRGERARTGLAPTQERVSGGA